MYQEHYDYKNQNNHKNQENQENEYKAAESSRTTSTSSSTTTTVYTDPGVSQISAMDKQTIAEAYCQTIRQNMTLQVGYYLESLLREGMEPEVILAAIQETGWAPRPSPQYLRAILQRCRAQGIYNMAQWEFRQSERQAAIDRANDARFSSWTSFPGDGGNLPF